MHGKTYMESPAFDKPDSSQRWKYAGTFRLVKKIYSSDIVRYHQQYKWIWLNRGKILNTPQIQSTNVTDLRFWDERIAGVLDAAGYNKKI